MMQKTLRMIETLAQYDMGIRLRVLSESYPMNTNMTALRFSKSFHSRALEGISLSIVFYEGFANDVSNYTRRVDCIPPPPPPIILPPKRERNHWLGGQ